MTSTTWSGTPGVFFAYPGDPALVSETLRSAAGVISKAGALSAKTWQDLVVDGRLVIDRVLEAIDDAGAVVAEVSDLNSNVLFEIGYAIAREKHVILALDETNRTSSQNWKSFGLLASVGYTPYGGSSEELASAVMRRSADLRETGGTLWDDLSARIAKPQEPRTLYFFPTSLRGDDARKLDRLLTTRRDLGVLRTDEDEGGYALLDWHVSQLYRSSAALIHLLGPQKARAVVHNSRASLLAGLSVGLGRPTLMVAEQSFTPPFDYQNLFFPFNTVRALTERVDQFLDELPALSSAPTGRVQLEVELPGFGEYVAENEQEELSAYFVDTAQYRRTLQSGTAIFVGRKGTGKTANMLRAAEELSNDKRNLVCVVKPSGYEFESLLSVLEGFPERDLANYFIDALWQYLLYCEIASSAIREADAKPAGIAAGSHLDILRSFMEANELGVEHDLAVRLERVIHDLSSTDRPTSGVEAGREELNRKLRSHLLRDLRRLVANALKGRHRVAVLIDNLDRAWEAGADYERLSRVILGLLTAVGPVSSEIAREGSWRDRVGVTLGVFLRADIFSSVLRYAREPDKIQTLQIDWQDATLLARVVEDRYVVAHDGAREAHELWTNFFCSTVRNSSTRDYLLWRALPRPRDLVYLCNAAVSSAINHRRNEVDESDIIWAEYQYSQFALEALIVESDPDARLADVVWGFAGGAATLSFSELESAIRLGLSGYGEVNTDVVVSALFRSSFLGLESSPDRFVYPADEAAERRARALARNLSQREKGRDARYRVHPAYRPFLEVDEDDLEG